jgi:light-regulated signal transduction histidine kinase (bacteriophytochrome)
MGDPSQLLQLLQNLISNAIKFHAEARRRMCCVECHRRSKRRVARSACATTASACAAEDSERIFEVFKRLHAADRYPGSGIGLSVCKRIIERHRGRIWARPNDDGIGATLLFTLPVMAE